MKKIDRKILKVIKPRNSNSHKGTYGRVLIIAGTKNFGGAAIMSSSAAVYAGAGLVTLATDSHNITAVNSSTPEVMPVSYDDNLIDYIKNSNVIAIGPGLGDNIHNEILEKVIKHINANQTLIIDASSLNTLAKDLSILNNFQGKLILTPHQMEWQRLSGIKIKDQSVERNADFISKMSGSPIVVLKSHQTNIYYKKNVYQNIPGNPGMATGGSGDILTGIIAAFCAQFGTSIETVNAAVYMHSAIANELYKTNYVVLPEKLIQKIPEYMKKEAD